MLKNGLKMDQSLSLPMAQYLFLFAGISQNWPKVQKWPKNGPITKNGPKVAKSH
jgi:hypothetical protein